MFHQPVAREAGNDAAADHADQQRQCRDAKLIAEGRGLRKADGFEVDQHIAEQKKAERGQHR